MNTSLIVVNINIWMFIAVKRERERDRGSIPSSYRLMETPIAPISLPTVREVSSSRLSKRV